MLHDTHSTIPADTTPDDHGDRVRRATRWLAIGIVLFLADAAQLLLLLPDRTAELFAWPIDVQVTSLVLGSAYVAGGYYFVRVALARSWHSIAVGFPPVIVFVWFAAGATALHLDRFTQGSLPFAAWAAIYALAPFGLPVLYIAQRRAGRAPGDSPLPVRVRIFMAATGGVVVLAAVAGFAAPHAMSDVWPWELTPLTARIVAAVVALFGSLWISVAQRAGATAARIPLEAHLVGLAFLLLAAARGHAEVDWSNPLAVVLVAGVAGMAVLDIGVLAHGARAWSGRTRRAARRGYLISPRSSIAAGT
jgi:hypothetical protein